MSTCVLYGAAAVKVFRVSQGLEEQGGLDAAAYDALRAAFVGKMRWSL